MADRILTLDIGASKIFLAEFSVKGSGAPRLLRAFSAALPTEGDEVGSPQKLTEAIRGVMAQNGVKPAPLYMALPGQSVFPRFVKLPPVPKDKVGEMVANEAEQNVPFPINEIVWDYQVVGGMPGVELDAVLLAVKQDNVKMLTDAVADAGLEPTVVDAAPTALYNAVRFCSGDAEGCTMVLDIGYRSTCLVFLEGDKVFTRNIPVAGYNITQEIQKSTNSTFQEAEKMKLSMGFVALGGTYAVTDDERADKLSKIIRNVVTRLHAEINRSINFYRSQQGGSPPARLLLAGNSSLLPYMDQFFADKFQIPVEYFNPAATIPVDPASGIDMESANGIVPLGNVVGLALRATDAAALKMNLLPPMMVAIKEFRRKVPYFILSAVGLLACAFCWNKYAAELKSGYEKQNDEIQAKVKAIQRDESSLQGVASDFDEVGTKISLVTTMSENRSAVVRLLESVQKSLPSGMWLTEFKMEPAPGGGWNRLSVRGTGFEKSLMDWADTERGGAGAKVASGAEAMDMFLAKLLKNYPKYFTDKSENSDAQSQIQQTKLSEDRVYREFQMDLLLKTAVGNPLARPESNDAEEE